MLTEHDSSFMTQLEKSHQFYTGNREQYESQLADLRAEYAENEKTINGLIDSLGMIGDSIAKPRVLKRIEELTGTNKDIENRIHELEGLTTANSLSDMEFDLLRQMLAMFRTNIDEMSIEEKRAAIRTVVRKVIWDGINVHVVLFGADEGEIEFPDVDDRSGHMDNEDGEEEPLEAFADVDYDDFEEENDCLGKLNPSTVVKRVGVRIANEILMHFRAQRKSAQDVSLSDYIETGADGAPLALMDVVAEDCDLLEQVSTREQVAQLRRVIDACLSEQERQVILLRYGLNGQSPKRQREVADITGISRSYV